MSGTVRDGVPPHLPGGLITAGEWLGHFLGCISSGCEATRCADIGGPRSRIDALDENREESTEIECPTCGCYVGAKRAAGLRAALAPPDAGR